MLDGDRPAAQQQYRRVGAALGQLFVWLVRRRGLVARRQSRHRDEASATEPARERVLSDAELVAIWNALDDRNCCTVQQSNSGGDYAALVRLLILTGARRQEVGGMCWSELDLSIPNWNSDSPKTVVDAGTWTLPAARSKNHRAHTITLPPAALDIIRSVPRRKCDQLFGSLWGEHRGFQTWGRSKQRLDAKLRFSEQEFQPWTLHDLRRTVATKMADIGIEPHVIEATLNYHSGFRSGVSGVYNRSSYSLQIATALARWSEYVAALVEGRASSNVVAIKTRV